MRRQDQAFHGQEVSLKQVESSLVRQNVHFFLHGPKEPRMVVIPFYLSN